MEVRVDSTGEVDHGYVLYNLHRKDHGVYELHLPQGSPDSLGECDTEAWQGGDLVGGPMGDRTGAAEVFEQRPRPTGADPWNRLEHTRQIAPLTHLLVVADCRCVPSDS